MVRKIQYSFSHAPQIITYSGTTFHTVVTIDVKALQFPIASSRFV
jgi:hypothetical protein